MATDKDPVDSATLDGLKRCSTSAIADTKRESVRALAPDIEPVHSDCAFAGTVRTVTLDPSALWAPVATLDAAREGDVVVVDTEETVDEAVWGELLSTYAAAAGVRGMVTNGAVRDVAGIRDVGFPVFARAVTPRGPSGSEERERDVRVTVGDASISPGDVLVGDESGVVAVERDAVAEVAAAAAEIAETEREVERLIGEGRSLEGAFEEAEMG